MKSKKKTVDEVLEEKKELKEANPEYRIQRALLLKEQIDVAKKELDEHKEFFKKTLNFNGTQTAKLATKAGTVVVKLAYSYKIITEKLPALKKIFGKMLGTYVQEKTEYSPTAAYRKLFEDDGFEEKEAIKEAVTVKDSISVDFLPIAS